MTLDEALEILKEHKFKINEITSNEFLDSSFYFWGKKKEELEKTKFFTRLYKWSSTTEIVQKNDRGCTIICRRGLDANLLDELLQLAKEDGIFNDMGLTSINSPIKFL